MPVYRSDHRVVGDLVLPTESPAIEFLSRNNFHVILKNGATNEDGLVVDMIATTIGPGSAEEVAESELQSALAECLDLLSFGTHTRFKIVEPKRLVEWDEGKKERKFRAFLKVDAKYPPSPELSKEYIDTAAVLEKSAIPDFTRRALKYFRYGLLDEAAEDQHMRFWLALEIIAENSKESIPVPIVCPSCTQAIRCGNCNTEPTRMPMAKQAIEAIINSVVGDKAKDASKRQFGARNGLMHGSSVSSIERKTKMSMEDLVNELGEITWHAIMSTISVSEDATLNFSHWNWEFVNRNMVVSMLGTFEHQGQTPHPEEDRIPNVQVTMHTRFGAHS